MLRGKTILERRDLAEEECIFDEADRKGIQEFLRNMAKDWPTARSIEPKRLAENGPFEGAYLIYSQLSADATAAWVGA